MEMKQVKEHWIEEDVWLKQADTMFKLSVIERATDDELLIMYANPDHIEFRKQMCYTVCKYGESDSWTRLFERYCAGGRKPTADEYNAIADDAERETNSHLVVEFFRKQARATAAEEARNTEQQGG
ncbi:hypothetical protein HOP38_16160 [Vibrio mediterranei]|uniref:hypothetical protein n=1 Tax=Vibrio mediterranei TaxID=689 RepID=UPI0017CBE336|nr:hypothetical protein [Vibrio mediterranei]NUW74026.1 hypothetical protein [Vibrio mediterranei]